MGDDRATGGRRALITGIISQDGAYLAALLLDKGYRVTGTLRPRSPHAVAKVAAHQMTTLYRIAYGLFCVNGILFNHESPLRGPEFVTAQIVHRLVRWQAGLDSVPVALGRRQHQGMRVTGSPCAGSVRMMLTGVSAGTANV